MCSSLYLRAFECSSLILVLFLYTEHGLNIVMVVIKNYIRDVSKMIWSYINNWCYLLRMMKNECSKRNYQFYLVLSDSLYNFVYNICSMDIMINRIWLPSISFPPLLLMIFGITKITVWRVVKRFYYILSR